MKILPYRRRKVADGMYVSVSEHFLYTDFGVRYSKKSDDNRRSYICEGFPGTGFFERDSESHSYHEYIRNILRGQHPTYWKLLLGREPDIKREMKEVSRALEQAPNPMQGQILECYYNSLAIARDEEYLERVVAAVKKKVRSRNSKFMSSVLSYYKNKISQLESDIREVEFDLRSTCSDEVWEAYEGMVAAFAKVAACRRVWHLNEHSRQRFVQVWFDLGTFCFIRSPHYLPIMRTSRGENIYLLPEHLIRARSSTDFEVIPLKRVTLVCQELAIEETVETLSSRLGDAASMIRIPDVDSTWYFNHVRPVMNFFAAYEQLRNVL